MAGRALNRSLPQLDQGLVPIAKRRAGGTLLIAMANPTVSDERPEAQRPPHTAPVTPTAPSRWTGGRIAMIVVESLLALVALGVIA